MKRRITIEITEEDYDVQINVLDNGRLIYASPWEKGCYLDSELNKAIRESKIVTDDD